MPTENLTTAQLTEQIQNFEKRRGKNAALLAEQQRKHDALLVERDTLTHASVEAKESEAVFHPAVQQIQNELEAIQKKLAVTLPKEEAAVLVKKRTQLERHLQNLEIALDTTLNEVEKIGKIFENGFDAYAISNHDQDTDAALLFLSMMEKNGRKITYGVEKEIGHTQSIADLSEEPKLWLQIDRGGKNGVDLVVDEKGNIIVTVDHHENGGTITPTSGAEGMYLLMKEIGYSLPPTKLVGPQGKDGVVIEEKTIEKFLELINAQDNLTYTYTLDELRKIYPHSLPGIMHMLPIKETLRVFALHGDNPYTVFTPEELNMKVMHRGGFGKKISNLIASQEFEIEGEKKSNVELSIEMFEHLEKESLAKWGSQSDMFGKTLIISSGELGIPSHTAYAKGYQTLVLLNPAKKSLSIFSRSTNMATAYERIVQKIPSAVFPRGTMIIVPQGKLTMTRSKGENQPLETLTLEQIEEEITDMLGLHKETVAEPVYSAGDVGARTSEDVSFNIPKGKNTKYSGHPLFRPGDAEQAKPDKGDGRMIPSAKPATFSRELPKQTIDPTLVFELPKVEKSAKDIGDEIDNLFREIDERHK